jgi:hypothetical protein
MTYGYPSLPGLPWYFFEDDPWSFREAFPHHLPHYVPSVSLKEPPKLSRAWYVLRSLAAAGTITDWGVSLGEDYYA